MSEARKGKTKRAPARYLERSAWTLARQHGPKRVQRVVDADLADVRATPDAFVVSLALDGLHVVLAKVGRDARLFDRELRAWTDPFDRIARAAAALPPDELVLEGVLVALDDAGRPSFSLLREIVAGRTKRPVRLVVTDARHASGHDLHALPLRARRRIADEIARHAPDTFALSPAIDADLDRAIAAAAAIGVSAITLDADLPQGRDAPTRILCHSPTGDTGGKGDKGGKVGKVGDDETPWLRSVSPPPAVTNADKLLYPNDRISKREVSAYYDDIAPVLLPYLADRPVVSQRFVDGIAEFTWYQHRLPPRAPDYVRPVWIEGNRRIVLDGRDALLWMVNQAAIVFHGWASRVSTLESPDWATIDLDPGEHTTWEQTIDVALAVRRLFELLDIPSFPKTSGQKGIHILVPMKPGQSPAIAHAFGARVAALVARLLPDVVTTDAQKEKRAGRLFLDVQQSYVGRQLVLPYSLRAADGAPASTPLLWSEVTPALNPRAFTLKTMRARLDRLGDPMAGVLASGVDLVPILARMPPG